MDNHLKLLIDENVFLALWLDTLRHFSGLPVSADALDIKSKYLQNMVNKHRLGDILQMQVMGISYSVGGLYEQGQEVYAGTTESEMTWLVNLLCVADEIKDKKEEDGWSD